MQRKLLFALLFLFLLSSGLFALLDTDLSNELLDEPTFEELFQQRLTVFTEAVSQVAYTMAESAESETSGSAHAFEAASDRATQAETLLNQFVSTVTTNQEVAHIQKYLATFSKESLLNLHVSNLVQKMLSDHITILNSDGFNIQATPKVVVEMQLLPKMLLNDRQRMLLAISIPEAEAIVALTDNKSSRRYDNFKQILSRHDCNLISYNLSDRDKHDQHNFYFSAKKYVIDALLGHFGGSIVSSNLKAHIKISTGGFWSGKKNVEFVLSPQTDLNVVGELAWFKSMVESDPLAYFSQHKIPELKKLGNTETIAGEQKLLLKNTIFEIWVVPNTGSVNDAIYSKKMELGDLYVSANN